MSFLRLKLLEQHDDALQKCVYCPKLCRAACPVSNAEPNEALTPWGKMSTSYFLAQGHVPAEQAHARTPYACTGCMACRERCDHGNEVATVLLDARAGIADLGLEPAAVRRSAARYATREAEHADFARRLGGGRVSRTRVLLGCGYTRLAPREAELGLRVVEALLGEPVQPVEVCCGMSLLDAGDMPGFMRAAAKLAAEVASAERFVVLDPGCARTLLVDYPRLGVSVREPTLLVDLAHRSIERFAEVVTESTLRYHDPCKLGRGLGRYDEPRALLERITGAAPAEFQRRREAADCSGGGGLLPVSMPDTSRVIAADRRAQHEDAGGGRMVTACASSLARFRSIGAPVDDLITWLARGLSLDGVGSDAAAPPAVDGPSSP
jgi:dimethylglycine catabolism B